jgi:hypothetical protein
MKEPKAAPLPAGPPAEPVSITPGVAALLRGGNGTPQAALEADAEQPAQPAAAPPGKRLLQASLVLADLLLLVFVTRLILAAHGPMGIIQLGLCVLALMVGAWLSCLALWLEGEHPVPAKSKPESLASHSTIPPNPS